MSSTHSSEAFEALLQYLRINRGFDFTGYKRSTLIRRVLRRMQALGISEYTDYQDYLEVHPDEFIQLFNTILINVTAFFRDTSVWEAITGQLVPAIIRKKPAGAPIRCWSAGCASGEEAYSLAMVLAEALGSEQFRERVKIYATDVDEEALIRARQATYSAREVAPVAPALLERYFDRIGHQFVFNKDLRRSVIFGRHDLLQDAPISRIDLLLCRNTLMYFNADSQRTIAQRLHFALNNDGLLVLGKAEMLSTGGGSFAPVDLKLRIFRKLPRPTGYDAFAVHGSHRQVSGGAFVPNARLRELAFDTSPVAQVVIDTQGLLVMANERARTWFGLHPRDIGRPLQDVQLSYRPIELRARIEQAHAEQSPVILREVEWPVALGDTRYLDLTIRTLFDVDGQALGTSIIFADATRYRQLQEEIQASHQELETALEELQSTNEELETTNEELQSTIEELETTNEELQSTNEELETMNEELQSTNEELQTTNEELRQRSDELNQANAFLEAVLSSWRGGIVVANRDLQIQVWTDRTQDLWGLRADEAVGAHLFNLDIGLPLDQLRQPIRACLSGESDSVELVVPATNRRGRHFNCMVMCMPLASGTDGLHGVLLMMEEARSDGQVA